MKGIGMHAHLLALGYDWIYENQVSEIFTVVSANPCKRVFFSPETI